MLDINCINVDADDEQTEEATEELKKNQSLAENLATCEWYYIIVHFFQKLEVLPGLSSVKPEPLNSDQLNFSLIKVSFIEKTHQESY